MRKVSGAKVCKSLQKSAKVWKHAQKPLGCHSRMSKGEKSEVSGTMVAKKKKRVPSRWAEEIAAGTVAPRDHRCIYSRED